MRVVLDSNVIVSGIIWGGIPRKILDLARDKHITLYTTPELLEELADVLSRDKFAALLAARGLTADKIMNGYALLSYVISAAPVSRIVPADADDDAVMACAIAAHANLIATGDKDLLVLNPFQNIAILKPTEALRKIAEHCGLAF
jgi:putative PIN family toxin of toxin-antitoxin system